MLIRTSKGIEIITTPQKKNTTYQQSLQTTKLYAKNYNSRLKGKIVNLTK